MTNKHTYNEVITRKGESHTISEWGKILGIPAGTIYNRRLRGRSVEECLFVGRKRGYSQASSHPWKAGTAI